MIARFLFLFTASVSQASADGFSYENPVFIDSDWTVVAQPKTDGDVYDQVDAGMQNDPASASESCFNLLSSVAPEDSLGSYELSFVNSCILAFSGRDSAPMPEDEEGMFYRSCFQYVMDARMRNGPIVVDQVHKMGVGQFGEVVFCIAETRLTKPADF